MTSHDPDGYQALVVRLKHIQCKQILSDEEVRLIRSLAFSYGGRKLSYDNAIKHLITALTPLAIKERLTS